MVRSATIEPIRWLDGKVVILDQSRLPWREVYLDTDDYQQVAQAIKELRIRGAPAIGVAAAYGIALGGQHISEKAEEGFLARLGEIMETMRSTRPTAVNLFKAIDRMKAVAAGGKSVAVLKAALLEEAQRIHAEEQESTRRLSQLGAELIEDGFTVLTHCNAGPLATAGYGTALGMIRAARERGKEIFVLATETRPLLQGARLTVWELKRHNIPHALITDSMAGHFMSRGRINCVVVGADRIAANGDVANKIGTYSLGVLAKENHIPFYVAAPTSTVDLSIASGEEIPIEERKPEEVTCLRGVRIAYRGVRVANPAFDVTPHRYVAAIVTERGIVRQPYEVGLKALFGS